MKQNNIKNFIEGNYYALKDKLLGNIPIHIKEQAIYRAMLCIDCLEETKCKVCKCSTPNMFFSPNKKDSLGKWGIMLSAKNWNKYKVEAKLNNINFLTTFKNIRKEMVKKNLKYFKPNEFVMGGKIVFNNMNVDFLEKIDTLREMIGEPINIVSSYRSPDYNKKVGGVTKSFHLQGRAIDIRCSNSKYRAKVLQNALALGLTVGVMRTALHIDDRDIKDQKVFHYYPRYGSNKIESEFNG
jgi:hypothetical protein